MLHLVLASSHFGGSPLRPRLRHWDTFRPSSSSFLRTWRAQRPLADAAAIMASMLGQFERNLNLWKKHLGHVPDSVWDFADGLETLVLADNDLADISERIGELRGLRMLDLGHNLLTDLPSNLGELVQLSDFLYLHDNQLATLPQSLQNLTKLRYLNLSENRFQVLPETVCAMTGLVELRLSDNELQDLPDSIGCLASLRELHLRNNRLRTLPTSVGELAELRQIDLRQNPISALPDSLLKLPKLEKLDLRWVTTLDMPTWLADLETKGCLVYR